MAVSINLLPAGEKNLYHQRRLDSKIFVMAIIVSCISIGVSALLFFYLATLNLDLDNTRDQISDNNSKITLLKPIQDKYQYLASNIQQIEALESKGINYEQTLRNISKTVPKNVQINTIQLSSLPKLSLSITATAATRRDAFKFYDKMRATPQFTNTTLTSFGASSSASSTNEPTTSEDNFGISMTTILSSSTNATTQETNK